MVNKVSEKRIKERIEKMNKLASKIDTDKLCKELREDLFPHKEENLFGKPSPKNGNFRRLVRNLRKQDEMMTEVKVRIGNLLDCFTTNVIRKKDMEDYNKKLNEVVDFIENINNPPKEAVVLKGLVDKIEEIENFPKSFTKKIEPFVDTIVDNWYDIEFIDTGDFRINREIRDRLKEQLIQQLKEAFSKGSFFKKNVTKNKKKTNK